MALTLLKANGLTIVYLSTSLHTRLIGDRLCWESEALNVVLYVRTLIVVNQVGGRDFLFGVQITSRGRASNTWAGKPQTTSQHVLATATLHPGLGPKQRYGCDSLARESCVFIDMPVEERKINHWPAKLWSDICGIVCAQYRLHCR